MAGYLSCITVGGGVPLFTRRVGDLKALPFPLLASLNGVALFSKSQDVTLLSTITKDCKLLWRDYHNSVRLIVAVPFDTISDVHLHRLLDNVFQSLVLLIGLEDLVAQRNTERIKKDLRAVYPLIDTLLECAVQPSNNHVNFGDVVGCTDCIAFPEANLLQSYLDSFVESVDSTYGCVFSNHGIVTATKNWFSLHPDEIVLLSLYLQSELWATLRDTPIFLPVKSPTVPFRLVTAELINGVMVCALCGPSPSLTELQPILQKVWKPSFSILASLASIQPRRFPPIALDKSILGFMMINLEKRRVISSLLPHYGYNPDNSNSTDNKEKLPISKKVNILRSFFRSVVGPIFPDIFIANPYGVDQSSGETISFKAPHVQLAHPVSETYISSPQYKCYALQHLQYQMFAIILPLVPNHSMRNICHRTLQQILKDKQFTVIK